MSFQIGLLYFVVEMIST